MRTIYLVKGSSYSTRPCLAADTVEDAIELAKALGMEPEDDTDEWVIPIPMIERG